MAMLCDPGSVIWQSGSINQAVFVLDVNSYGVLGCSFDKTSGRAIAPDVAKWRHVIVADPDTWMVQPNIVEPPARVGLEQGVVFIAKGKSRKLLVDAAARGFRGVTCQ